MYTAEAPGFQELLGSRINNLPENLITKLNLFLADPAGFAGQLMTNSIVAAAAAERHKRSSDDCNIDYSLESVGLDIKMTCDDPKIPLKVGITLLFSTH